MHVFLSFVLGVLKIAGFIHISWLWVLAPVWGTYLAIIVIAILSRLTE